MSYAYSYCIDVYLSDDQSSRSLCQLAGKVRAPAVRRSSPWGISRRTLRTQTSRCSSMRGTIASGGKNVNCRSPLVSSIISAEGHDFICQQVPEVKGLSAPRRATQVQYTHDVVQDASQVCAVIQCIPRRGKEITENLDVEGVERTYSVSIRTPVLATADRGCLPVDM
ncbi:hypothetical protein BDW22DRAFT_1352535 [Trametopsis cervina]|nr:hypothetical protein BDW22DRAFT_1352535 [Trametopsis cervina]